MRLDIVRTKVTHTEDVRVKTIGSDRECKRVCEAELTVQSEPFRRLRTLVEVHTKTAERGLDNLVCRSIRIYIH